MNYNAEIAELYGVPESELTTERLRAGKAAIWAMKYGMGKDRAREVLRRGLPEAGRNDPDESRNS